MAEATFARFAHAAPGEAVRPARRPASSRPVLVDVPRPDGPHVRLGLATLMAAAGAVLAGPGWLAVGMAALGLLAAASIVTRHRSLIGLPQVVAVAGGGLTPLVALGGGEAVARMLPALLLGALVGELARQWRRGGPPADGAPRQVGRVGAGVMLGALAGLAAAAPVLVRGVGLGPTMGLLVMAAAYDAGAYVVGVGAHSRWEGPAAGAVAVVVAGFPLAVFNVFGADGVGNVVLVGAFAVLAPLGPVLARLLTPRRVPPVLGRLDVVLVAGPIWPWVAAALR